MTDDPLEQPAARAWRLARRESLVPPGFALHLPVGPDRTAARLAHGLPGWLRATAVAAGGAWFLARLAGLFLPFTVR